MSSSFIITLLCFIIIIFCLSSSSSIVIQQVNAQPSSSSNYTNTILDETVSTISSQTTSISTPQILHAIINSARPTLTFDGTAITVLPSATTVSFNITFSSNANNNQEDLKFIIQNAKFPSGVYIQIWNENGANGKVEIEKSIVNCSSTSADGSYPCAPRDKNPLVMSGQTTENKFMNTALRIEVGTVNSNNNNNNNIISNVISISQSQISVTQFFEPDISFTNGIFIPKSAALLVTYAERISDQDQQQDQRRPAGTSLRVSSSRIHVFVSSKQGIADIPEAEKYPDGLHCGGIIFGEKNFEYIQMFEAGIFATDRSTMLLSHFEITDDTNVFVRNDVSNAMGISISHAQVLANTNLVPSNNNNNNINFESMFVHTISNRFIDSRGWSIGIQLSRVNGGSSSTSSPIPSIDTLTSLSSPISPQNHLFFNNCTLRQEKSENDEFQVKPGKWSAFPAPRSIGIILQRADFFADIFMETMYSHQSCGYCSMHFVHFTHASFIQQRIRLNKIHITLKALSGEQSTGIVFWNVSDVPVVTVNNILKFDADQNPPRHSRLVYVVGCHTESAMNVQHFSIGDYNSKISINSWSALTQVSIGALQNVGTYIVEKLSGRVSSRVITVAVLFRGNLSKNVGQFIIRDFNTEFNTRSDPGVQAAGFIIGNCTLQAKLLLVQNCTLNMVNQVAGNTQNSVIFILAGASGGDFIIERVQVFDCNIFSAGGPSAMSVIQIGIDADNLPTRAPYRDNASFGTVFEVENVQVDAVGTAIAFLWVAGTTRAVPTYGYNGANALLAPNPSTDPFGWIGNVYLRNVRSRLRSTFSGSNHINLHNAGINSLTVQNSVFEFVGANDMPFMGRTSFGPFTYPGNVGFVNVSANPGCNFRNGVEVEKPEVVADLERSQMNFVDVFADGCGVKSSPTVTMNDNNNNNNRDYTHTKTRTISKTFHQQPPSITKSVSEELPPLDVSGAPVAAATIGGFASASSLMLAAGPSIALDASRALSVLGMASRCRSYADQMKANEGFSKDEHRKFFVDNYLKMEVGWPNNLFMICFGEARGRCIRGAVLSALLGCVLVFCLSMVFGYTKWKEESKTMSSIQKREMSFFRFCRLPVFLGNFFVWLFPTWAVFAIVLIAVPDMPATDMIFFSVLSFVIFFLLISAMFKIIYSRVDAEPIVWIKEEGITMFAETILEMIENRKNNNNSKKRFDEDDINRFSSRRQQKNFIEDEDFLHALIEESDNNKKKSKSKASGAHNQNEINKGGSSSGRNNKIETNTSRSNTDEHQSSQQQPPKEESPKTMKLRSCFRWIEDHLLRGKIGAFFCFGDKVWTEPNVWKKSRPVVGGGIGSYLWNVGSFLNKQVGPYVEEKPLLDVKKDGHNNKKNNNNKDSNNNNKNKSNSPRRGSRRAPPSIDEFENGEDDEELLLTNNSHQNNRRNHSSFSFSPQSSRQDQKRNGERKKGKQTETVLDEALLENDMSPCSSSTTLSSLGAVATKRHFISTFRLRWSPFYAFFSFLLCLINTISEAVAIINPNLCNAALIIAAVINILGFIFDSCLRPFAANFRNLMMILGSGCLAFGASIVSFTPAPQKNEDESSYNSIQEVATVFLIMSLVIGMVSSLTNAFFKMMFLITGGEVVLRRDAVDRLEDLMNKNVKVAERRKRERAKAAKGAAMVGGANVGGIASGFASLL